MTHRKAFGWWLWVLCMFAIVGAGVVLPALREIANR
jgi:hypothetical protein